MAERELTAEEFENIKLVLDMVPQAFEAKSLFKLINYLEEAERDDWEEMGKPLKHIYQDVMVTKRYLARLKATTMKYKP